MTSDRLDLAGMCDDIRAVMDLTAMNTTQAAQ